MTQQSLPMNEVASHIDRGNLILGRIISDIAAEKPLAQWPDMPADLAQEVRSNRTNALMQAQVSRGGSETSPLMLPVAFVHGLIEHGAITMRDDWRTEMFCNKHQFPLTPTLATPTTLPILATVDETAA